MNDKVEVSYEQLFEFCKNVKRVITNWVEEITRLMERIESCLKVDEYYYGKIFFQYQSNVVNVFKIPKEHDPEKYTKIELIKYAMGRENPTEYGATFEKRIAFERKDER